MVDTIRDKASLLALLPDNTSGQISPQDLRDVLVSLHGVHACLTFTPLTAVAIVGAAAALKPWAAGFVNSGMTVDATNGKFTAITAGTYKVHFNISFTVSPTVPATATFNLHLTGDAIVANGGACHIGLTAVNLLHNDSFTALVALNAGDELEIFSSATIADNLATVYGANFAVERVA